jgi:hypothetical protein
MTVNHNGRRGVAILLMLGATLTAGAQSGSVARKPVFRAERQVQPGGPGPNRLALDEVIVGAGQPFRVMPVPGVERERDGARAFVAEGGLGDLRLIDRAGREVPYLLVPPQRPTANWVAGSILPLLSTKTASGFELTLAQPMLVDRLRVNGLPQRFLKRATLEGSGDRARWTVLDAQVTLFDLPDQRLQQLEVAFAPSELRYLRLTWDDRNSGKVPLPATVTVREGTPLREPEPLRVQLRVEKRSSEPGRSRYRIVFPAAGLPVTDLEVDAADANILRPVRVTEPQLSGDRLVPLELGSGTLRRASRDDLSAADLRVPIRVPTTTQADLTIEDGSNAPLNLNGVFAVLAPLPWIYFESPDGAPLTARIGDPKLAAPSYDLEAVRPNLPKLSASAVAAQWEPSLTALAPSPEDANPVPASVALSGASIDVSNFLYARPVPASTGLTALALDAAVLAHSRLSDLRLVDREGHQHAYVLESRDEPLTQVLGPLKAGAPPAWMPAESTQSQARGSRTAGGNGNRTTYVLQLPYEGLPASQLVLTTRARVFTRQVRVLVEQQPLTPRDTVGSRGLAASTWEHADPNDPAPRLTLDLPALKTKELVLMIDEGDNAPLAIDSATLLLPGYQVRFVRTDGLALTLYYGDESVSAPRYDLALLKPYLLGAPASDIAPGPEQERAPAAMAVRLPVWAFWGVLIVAVLVLLALIVRLLRSEEATPA